MAKPIESALMRFFYGPSIRYRPVQDENNRESNKLFSFRLLAVITLGLPLFGFTFCVVWSMLYNYEDATSTHCGVDNWLPSVSASIGAFSPQKYVWRLTIGVHSAPRFLVALIYFLLIHESRILLALNMCEVGALVGLSMVSSTENFVIHAQCFLLFITASFFGFVLHLQHDRLWSLTKLRIFCVNSLSWILALFFYARHNSHCETGMYTLFAGSEYFFVLTNMFFHFQAAQDFDEMSFYISKLVGPKKLDV